MSVAMLGVTIAFVLVLAVLIYARQHPSVRGNRSARSALGDSSPALYSSDSSLFGSDSGSDSNCDSGSSDGGSCDGGGGDGGGGD